MGPDFNSRLREAMLSKVQQDPKRTERALGLQDHLRAHKADLTRTFNVDGLQLPVIMLRVLVPAIPNPKAKNYMVSVLLGEACHAVDKPELKEEGLFIRLPARRHKELPPNITTPEFITMNLFQTYTISIPIQQLALIQPNSLCRLSGVNASFSKDGKLFIGASIIEALAPIPSADMFKLVVANGKISKRFYAITQEMYDRYSETDKGSLYDDEHVYSIFVPPKDVPAAFETLTISSEFSEASEKWIYKDKKGDQHTCMKFLLIVTDQKADDDLQENVLLECAIFEKDLHPFLMPDMERWEHVASRVLPHCMFAMMGKAGVGRTKEMAINIPSSDFGNSMDLDGGEGGGEDEVHMDGLSEAHGSLDFSFALNLACGTIMFDAAAEYKKVGIPVSRDFVLKKLSAKQARPVAGQEPLSPRLPEDQAIFCLDSIMAKTPSVDWKKLFPPGDDIEYRALSSVKLTTSMCNRIPTLTTAQGDMLMTPLRPGLVPAEGSEEERLRGMYSVEGNTVMCFYAIFKKRLNYSSMEKYSEAFDYFLNGKAPAKKTATTPNNSNKRSADVIFAPPPPPQSEPTKFETSTDEKYTGADASNEKTDPAPAAKKPHHKRKERRVEENE